MKEGVILLVLKKLKPVHDAPMARDDVAKVLDLECSLETRGKEAAKGTDDGGEEGEEESVDEEGEEGDRLLHLQQPPPRRQRLQRKVNMASKIRIKDLTMGEVVLCLNFEKL